jgi:hypothetical protein
MRRSEVAAIKLKHILESLRRPRLFFPAVGIVILIFWGVSIFSTPSFEIMYNHRLLPVMNTKKGALYAHILEIGNTGRNLQENVDILFSNDALAYQVMRTQVKNFGKVDRKVRIFKNDTTTRIALGPLEPGKRVEISLTLFYKHPDNRHEWTEILQGIEIARGKLVEGDPSWTTLGRMLYKIFGSLI